MRRFTFLLLIMTCVVLLFENCKCNDGEVLIPCSIEEDLGIFKDSRELPYLEAETLDFRNSIGDLKQYHVNNPDFFWLYGINSDTLRDLESPCFSTLNEIKYTWQESRFQALFTYSQNRLEFWVREELIIDPENPTVGVQGKVLKLFINSPIGGFGDESTVVINFPKTDELIGNPEFDFGYNFFEKITFNGKEFEDIFAPKSTGNDKILNLYFSKEGKLIAFEDADDGIFVIEN